MKKRTILSFALPFLIASASFAENYDFADPKGVNSISFFVDSPLEPIMGFANGITGTIDFNRVNPAATKGSIEFPVKNIRFASDRMGGVLQGDDWLKSDINPMVKFTITSIGAPSVKDGSIHATVNGKMSLAGMEKEITAPIVFTHIPDGAKQRGGAQTGDLLLVRSKFILKRDMFGIQPGKNLEKVGNDIQINVAISGYQK